MEKLEGKFFKKRADCKMDILCIVLGTPRSMQIIEESDLLFLVEKYKNTTKFLLKTKVVFLSNLLFQFLEEAQEKE